MVTLRQHHGRPVDTNTPHIPVRGSAECSADHRGKSTLIDELVWTTGGTAQNIGIVVLLANFGTRQ